MKFKSPLISQETWKNIIGEITIALKDLVLMSQFSEYSVGVTISLGNESRGIRRHM